MELQENQAKAIVKEINQVLPQKINLMNRKGLIIASTDPERVNTYHGGAARIIREGLDELRISYDDEFPGTRRGTNFALKVEGEPIGVLGITGEYEEILPLANIIRKMTELLVHQQEYARLQSNLRYQQSLFLAEVLAHSEAFLSREQIEHGRDLGIELQMPRRILVADFVARDNELLAGRHEILQRLEPVVRKADSRCICTVTSQLMVFLTSICDREGVYELAVRLREAAGRQGWDICVGIDGQAQDSIHLSDAFLQAKKALQSCHRKGNIRIKGYDEINMEIFADMIPLMVKQRYVQKIFKGYTRQELAEAMNTLECFFEHDGSIIRTAEALFIHKNTLQQHLKRIAARTGYDPRSLRSSAVFYLVIYFYQEMNLQ